MDFKAADTELSRDRALISSYTTSVTGSPTFGTVCLIRISPMTLEIKQPPVLTWVCMLWAHKKLSQAWSSVLQAWRLGTLGMPCFADWWKPHLVPGGTKSKYGAIKEKSEVGLPALLSWATAQAQYYTNQNNYLKGYCLYPKPIIKTGRYEMWHPFKGISKRSNTCSVHQANGQSFDEKWKHCAS